MNQFEPNAPNLSSHEKVEDDLSIEKMELKELEYETQSMLDFDILENIQLEEDFEELDFSDFETKLFGTEKQKVSGRYENDPNPWKLDLRIDVDGHRPLKRVSGDFYMISGNTESYYGSFVVNALRISYTDSSVTLSGFAETTWKSNYKKIKINIPRREIFQSKARVRLQWLTADDLKGATYVCKFKSKYFRAVEIEQDFEEGVQSFSTYNTGLLPSGGAARDLSVVEAYREAGVEMRDIGSSNKVSNAPGGEWTNAELHNAMEAHFSRWKDDPQWKVWLFHAMKHEKGPRLRGIMFDRKSKQRQGCASFYQVMGGTSPENLREQLYVGVHELGHCFNLYHSFHKKYMNPPKPNRIMSKSWMNYPWKYPGGPNAFWSVFPFQFDNLELIHLRHAFRDDIVMGGNPFGKGAAAKGVDGLDDNIYDNSGLKLELRLNESFALGEPVVVEIKLSTTNLNGVTVHKQLHPDMSFVQIAIEQPNGGTFMFEPPIEHLVEFETVRLNEKNPAIYESAYIGYDKDYELVFDSPGMYKLRGIYYALDGSIILSEPVAIRIRSPLQRADENVADLMLKDEVGMLFYLLGSDSKYLEGGNEALEQVINKHSKHPLAVFAQLAKGINLTREFKSIEPDNEIEKRDPDVGVAEQLLTEVVDASKEEKKGVDNITLNMTMKQLARAQGSVGKKKEAKATMKKMVNIFEKQKLNPHVMATIKEQAKEVTSEL